MLCVRVRALCPAKSCHTEPSRYISAMQIVKRSHVPYSWSSGGIVRECPAHVRDDLGVWGSVAAGGEAQSMSRGPCRRWCEQQAGRSRCGHRASRHEPARWFTDDNQIALGLGRNRPALCASRPALAAGETPSTSRWKPALETAVHVHSIQTITIGIKETRHCHCGALGHMRLRRTTNPSRRDGTHLRRGTDCHTRRRGPGRWCPSPLWPSGGRRRRRPGRTRGSRG